MPNQSTSARCAEVAGGTAAECAVICCCFPCGILNLAILALYTIPTGICKKMFFKKKKRRRHHQKNKLLLKRGGDQVVVRRRPSCAACGCESADRQVYPVTTSLKEEDVERLEKEMWDTFYTTGFWRSPSQRHNS